jgi:hypothetical protein
LLMISKKTTYPLKKNFKINSLTTLKHLKNKLRFYRKTKLIKMSLIKKFSILRI